MKRTIQFTLNGHEVSAEVESHKMLLEVIRDVFELKGTKEACGQGECGACTILIDGISVNSCLYPAYEGPCRLVGIGELDAQGGYGEW